MLPNNNASWKHFISCSMGRADRGSSLEFIEAVKEFIEKFWCSVIDVFRLTLPWNHENCENPKDVLSKETYVC